MNKPSKPRPPSVKLPSKIKVDMVATSDEDSKKSKWPSTYGDVADAFNYDDAITWSEKFNQEPEMSRDEFVDLEFE